MNVQEKRLAIIADDEDLGRVLLCESVAAVGLESLAFANGDEALDSALKNDVAIVLLDVDMPGLNGNEVCRRLRADPRFRSVPIVMVTGHQDSDAVRRAFEAGATDFISKPVNWALLPRRLEYILRNAAAAEHIERLAYYDTLTGLPNRQRCIDLTGTLFETAAQRQESVAVVYLDLNSFKRVNDTFGHAVGDEVLRIFASRLTRTLAKLAEQHPRMVVARFGGDEFVISLQHAQAREIGMQIAAACHAAFEEPIAYESLEFYSAPSIGIAVYPDDGADVATVLKHADTAMYQSKSGAAGPIAVYAPAMSRRLRDWLDLEARLRHAVHDNLLNLVFQPKFNLRENRLVGVEALLRWRDEEYGDISPARFVEIAEDSGLIIDMGGWVVRAACRQLRKWL
ncbi:MAG TPA: diguanylate cyclase, partial [Woeseiaceae bacterium]|nr:diguanylate cyclase [Woeseiaceae bacterium]